jgi:hypothetical protein
VGFNAALPRAAIALSESDKHLHIHLNFSLFLSGIMGKKFAAQTESCIVDEKVHMNTARFSLFRDSLRTVRINKINAENSALNLSAGDQGITSFLLFATSTRATLP